MYMVGILWSHITPCVESGGAVVSHFNIGDSESALFHGRKKEVFLVHFFPL